MAEHDNRYADEFVSKTLDIASNGVASGAAAYLANTTASEYQQLVNEGMAYATDNPETGTLALGAAAAWGTLIFGAQAIGNSRELWDYVNSSLEEDSEDSISH